MTNRKKIKERSLEYVGINCCVVCGYCRTNSALHFHHIKEKKENVNISRLVRESKSWERIREELDKCIVLCANCHCEFHDGLITHEDLLEALIKNRIESRVI